MFIAISIAINYSWL